MNNVPFELGIPDYEFRLVFGRTKIDYDPIKEESNRKNHGYSLESAVHVLEKLLLPIGNQNPYVRSDPFIERGEVRQMHITVDDSGNVVLMVTTMRAEETVRVVSFRAAHKKERAQFKHLTGYVKS